MTVLDLMAALALVLACVGAAVLTWPAARNSGLGPLHPLLLWLALQVVLFGIGGLALAIVDGRPGPALYLAASVSATALGTFAADRWVGRAQRHVAPPGGPSPDLEVTTGSRRWWPIILALLSVVVLLPILIRTGLPLLTPDATSARAALTGLTVQLVRVSVPALAVVIVLRLTGGGSLTGRRWVDIGLVGCAFALTIALASRYLALELVAAVALAWLLAGRPIRLRIVAVGSLIAVIGFVAVGLVRAPSQIGLDPVASTITRTVSRLFLVQPRTLATLQEVIPSETPYFWGATWLRRIGPLIGRDDVPNIGYWIYPRVVTEAQDVAGYAAPGLIGEAWANFGPAGVGLFAVLGAGLGLTGTWIGRHRSRVEDIAVGSLIVLFLARTHALGLLGAGQLIALVAVWRAIVAPWPRDWRRRGARLHMTDGPTDATGSADSASPPGR